jgi:hypothetical protein
MRCASDAGDEVKMKLIEYLTIICSGLSIALNLYVLGRAGDLENLARRILPRQVYWRIFFRQVPGTPYVAMWRLSYWFIGLRKIPDRMPEVKLRYPPSC